jgi:hypothetical protein
MYRQGDILIVRTINEEIQGQELPLDERGRVILALGDTTGHAHAIESSHAKIFSSDSGSEERILLQVYGHQEVDLVHEEHTTVSLKPGTYRIIRQREYSPEDIHYVQD